MRLIVKPFAKLDLDDSIAWYEDKIIGLGKDFLRAIYKVFEIIRRNPKAFEIKIVRKGLPIRAVPIDRFPFQVHYHIDELKQTIFVEAIWHTARNPARWKKRI